MARWGKARLRLNRCPQSPCHPTPEWPRPSRASKLSPCDLRPSIRLLLSFCGRSARCWAKRESEGPKKSPAYNHYAGPSFRHDSLGVSADSVIHQEAAQLLAAARMTQLAQPLGLYLADPLASDIELLAHFFERVVGIHVDPEPHPQHLRFPWCQLRKYRVGGFAQ